MQNRIILIVAILAFWAQPAQWAAAEGTNVTSSNAVAVAKALGEKAKFESTLSYQLNSGPGRPPVTVFDSSKAQHEMAQWAIVCGVLSILGTVILVRMFAGRISLWSPVAAKPGDAGREILAEDKALNELVHTLRGGKLSPATPVSATAAKGAESTGSLVGAAKGTESADSKTEVIAKPQEKAAVAETGRSTVDPQKHLAEAKKMLAKVEPGNADAARQNVLQEVMREVTAFKNLTGQERVVAWQLSSALEGLLKQLTERAREVTHSTLRTATNALDLLEQGNLGDSKPNVFSEPPVRILVVDDDAISRQAVSSAVKKVFGTPDLAADGAAALTFAANQTYDVVFLDVEMPGMDGFEVCSKLHETKTNATTPVVFVTAHNNFESRAKSELCGGHDLLGKPFLTFELALKALTLVVRNRAGTKEPRATIVAVHESSAAAEKPPEAQKSAETPAASDSPVPLVSESSTSSASTRGNTAFITKAKLEQKGIAEADPLLTETRRGTFGTDTSLHREPAPQELADAFYAKTPGQLEFLARQVDAISKASDPATRQKGLGVVYVGMHTITQDAERAKLTFVQQLSWALESMLKKLLEAPQQMTASAMDMAMSSLQLLEELTVSRNELKLGSVRILIVDDDMVSRRALASSLQIIFGRPESADSGEAGLALATEKPFDLIFMDVRMPGMDGFACCSKIRETTLNAHTPVVFVTAHSDEEARTKADLSGGDGFIAKPILASEIRLTALTFALCGALRKAKGFEPELASA